MKKLIAIGALCIGSACALANPPYDVTVVQPGSISTGGPPDLFELWQDCTTTPVLVDADVQIPETYVGLLPADGSYNFCIRGSNAAGLGPVGQTVDITVAALVAPGPVDSGTVITVQCPNGPCTTTITPN